MSERLELTARMATEEAVESLTERLGRLDAQSITIEDRARAHGHPYGRWTWTFKKLPQAIEAYHTFFPSTKGKPRNSRMIQDYYRGLGYIQHYVVPADLRRYHERIAKFLGRPDRIPHHTKAYQPEGPWEYVAPDHGRDWRSRARWVVPTEGQDISLVTLAFHTSPFTKRARVTIDYNSGQLGV